GLLRLADLILDEIEVRLTIVAFDREHFLEDRLQADVFAFRRANIRLQELFEGLDLRLNQLRCFNHVADLAKIFTLSHFVASRASLPYWLRLRFVVASLAGPPRSLN